VSRHVVFDESSFPFANMSTSPVDPTTLTFLSDEDTVILPIGPSVAAAGTPTVADAAPGAAAPVDPPSQAAASSAPGTPGATDGDHAAPASPGAAVPGDPSP
jgi:hypothetical protein